MQIFSWCASRKSCSTSCMLICIMQRQKQSTRRRASGRLPHSKKDALAQTNKPTNACPSFLRVRALCKCKMWFILLYFTPNERRIRAPAQHWFKMQKILLKAVTESAPRLRSARKNSSCSHAQLKTQSVTQKSSPMQLPRIWRHERRQIIAQMIALSVRFACRCFHPAKRCRAARW